MIVVTSVVDPRLLAQIADHKPFHVVHRPWDIEALDRLVAAAATTSPPRFHGSLLVPSRRVAGGAVRQMLGHTKLPDFVGGFGKHQYRPEAADRARAS